jgi:hypothetical protein
MDSVGAAFLWFFGGLFGAALLGALVGRVTDFVVGMSIGLPAAPLGAVRESCGAVPPPQRRIGMVRGEPPAPHPAHAGITRVWRFPRRLMRELNWGFNLAMLGGILWVAFAPTGIERGFMAEFAIVAFSTLGHAIKGLRDPAVGPQWSLGMFVIAANFGAFSLALWLLT